jgi:GT2 family glycosyltransferase
MVPWASGCCLLIRRDCLKDIGVLDPDFFLYYEDVDLCRRAWAKGWAVWHEPAVTLTHHCPLHLREVPAPLRVVTRHALLVYGHKHWPGWHNRILRLVIRTEIFWRQRWTTDLRSQASWKALSEIVSALADADLAKSRSILEALLELSTNPYSKNVRAA